jgi:hypothetical protein
VIAFAGKDATTSPLLPSVTWQRGAASTLTCTWADGAVTTFDGTLGVAAFFSATPRFSAGTATITGYLLTGGDVEAFSPLETPNFSSWSPGACTAIFGTGHGALITQTAQTGPWSTVLTFEWWTSNLDPMFATIPVTTH